ncbi:hypothetical protein cce_2808 [Crocosphaera subtropica ATCC 51142]|uniref:Uncharacterized protein n=1 Tax=Crocosphaera subtropica (strain ATCC 51142 / BH68) TaxID=43989 RepID=B1WU94_CROS5|nr:hypothetical protein [Crocosphaera subtropica]ACB52156.1 hypothetical protein cce_2808 [Crocosphaera subtropica ATCC 51142]
MSEHIINVTAILIQQEIDRFFVKYPQDNPYKILFSRPYFQKELLKKVLSQIPNHHVVIYDKHTLINHDDYDSFIEEKRKLKALINQAVPKVLTENYQKVGEILVRERSKTNLSLIWEDD